MNDHSVHRDDIAALRQEGDLPAYMRRLNSEGRSRLGASPVASKRKKKPKWGAIPIPEDHRPGAWPPGTHPPGPPPERDLPPEAWAAAARHHSNERNRPDEPCDCGNCPDEAEEAKR